MKVSKAIEELKDILQYHAHALDTDGFKAVQLGIEALKRVKEKRRYGIAFGAYHLPGESPEGEIEHE